MRTRTHRHFAVLLIALLFCAALASTLASQDDWSQRDVWQHPAQIMDAIGAKPGSAIADVGAGEGYFTFRLASRVGAQGKVYAVDIVSDDLKKIRDRAAKENLPQIETIQGATNDPKLPAASLDAILVVNAYHEMTDFDAMMAAFFRALKPGATLAILDAKDEPGQPRSSYQSRHTLPQQFAREDAARAGFHFLRELPGFHNPKRDKDFYFLLFQKPAQ